MYEKDRSPILRRRAGSSYLLHADERSHLRLGMSATGESVEDAALSTTDVGVVHSQVQLLRDTVLYWKPVEFA